MFDLWEDFLAWRELEGWRRSKTLGQCLRAAIVRVGLGDRNFQNVQEL